MREIQSKIDTTEIGTYNFSTKFEYRQLRGDNDIYRQWCRSLPWGYSYRMEKFKYMEGKRIIR